ncbi:Fic family protein [Cryobacterium sp. N19]|uniref:Fic family protein n=1 Tax=Cryobacterium sp. N19 TaxID=2048288 RepID=UPI000CE4E2A9|nr:Fic family protein [Cryobacterium sp. N19]
MHDIEYPAFAFDSDLTREIIAFERARANLSRGTTPSIIYSQLKELFQLLTSIMSARIEGNRTSILDAVTGAAESRLGNSLRPQNEGVREILNIQRAITFIDANVGSSPVDHLFIRELHRIVVDGLSREGDHTPGAYRLGEVSIGHSAHHPPWPSDVPDYMSVLVAFIAQPQAPHNQLLQTAIVHHRFLWIHPFGNGNGRVARLITYAMLIQHGFSSSAGYGAVNPTAVFGADRQAYYDNLELADTLENDGVVAWCTYVLRGLNSDLANLARLSDAEFVIHQVLVPAVERLRAAGGLTLREAEALSIAAAQTTVKAADLESAFPGSASSRSHAIKRLIDRGLLVPVESGARSYRLAFVPNDLTVHLVRRLDMADLLPTILKDHEL